jgi:hypothetical protein
MTAPAISTAPILPPQSANQLIVQEN